MLTNLDVDETNQFPELREFPGPTHPDGSSIGIVGLGDWGQRAILGTLLGAGSFDVLSHLHLVAGDNHAEAVQRFARNPRITVYPSAEYREVLRDPSVSSVLICTPDETHYALAKAALNAGKHIFVEKTFVTELEQAVELVRLADAERRTLAVGYEYMYDYRFVALQDALDSGVVGSPLEIDLDILNRYSTSGSVREKYRTSIVQHHVTHQLSILQLLLGNHAVDELEVLEAEPDRVQLRFGYSGCVIRCTTAVDQRQKCNHRTIRVKGTDRLIELDFDGSDPRFQVVDARSFTTIPRTSPDYPAPLVKLHPSSSIQRELEDFFVHCVRQRTPISGGENALHLVRLTGEIDRAYSEKRRATLSAGQEHERRYAEELRTRMRDLVAANECDPESVGALRAFRDSTPHSEGYVERTRRVVEYLSRRPYAPAAEVMKVLGLTRDELKIAYKLIQGSPMSHRLLRAGHNYDYFDVVYSFFDRNHFEATFFVGLACPYRCIFCKTTMASGERTPEDPIRGRHLPGRRFGIRGDQLLSESAVQGILDDLVRIREGGKRVSVKISGGLEPMSDFARVSFLIQEAGRRAFPVCVYSNGILMKTPETRRVILQSTDLRISLNAVNEQDYQATYLPDGRKNQHVTFPRIVEILRALVLEKQQLSSTTTIGINYVVLRENVFHMTTMAEICAELKVDYLNFNADYFDDFGDHTYLAIGRQIDRIQQKQQRGEFDALRVKFGGALLSRNVFSTQPDGHPDPTPISRFKVFIDPAGRVTPIHEGTFPAEGAGGELIDNPYVIGHLSEETGLIRLLEKEKSLRGIALRHLAPLELFLRLELSREEQDARLGLEPHTSPYRPSCAAERLSFEGSDARPTIFAP